MQANKMNTQVTEKRMGWISEEGPRIVVQGEVYHSVHRDKPIMSTRSHSSGRTRNATSREKEERKKTYHETPGLPSSRRSEQSRKMHECE
jgi:hypothetical protein